MQDFLLGTRRVSIDLNDPFAEGGEARVFALPAQPAYPAGTLLKVFLKPDDPTFLKATDVAVRTRNQTGAERRLRIHQAKLPAFPRSISDRIVAPLELARERPKGRIVGYEMPRINGDVMADYADIEFREKRKIDNNGVRDIFLDWLDTIDKLHPTVVMGDVNPLNQIVTLDGKVYIIDADSMQFGGFPCETFTVRFVDPLICKTHEDVTVGAPAQPPKPMRTLVMSKSHTSQSDMFSVASIFWLVNTYVGVWEGSLPLKTKDATLRDIRPLERPLRRISVMHPEVIFPKWATHWENFPDEVLDYYDKLLHKDVRTGSLRTLIERIRWTNCSSCGRYHARGVCPVCAMTNRPPELVVATITANVEIERAAVIPGRPLKVVFQDGKLKYLYHENGEYFREFGPIGLTMDVAPDLHVEISGERTMLGANGRVVRFAPGSKPQPLSVDRFRDKAPVIGANSRNFFWARGGQLFREGISQSGDYIDASLQHQTLLWVGEKFGLAFYSVSGLQKVKVFDVDGTGAVSVDNVPDIDGTILKASCYFSATRAWLFIAAEKGGTTYHSCFVIKPNGECSAHLTVEQGDPDHAWLSSGFIHLGKTAARLPAGGGKQVECLLAATDTGVAVIMENKGTLAKVSEFAGTAGHVLPTDQLLYEGGLFRVRGGAIHQVKTK